MAMSIFQKLIQSGPLLNGRDVTDIQSLRVRVTNLCLKQHVSFLKKRCALATVIPYLAGGFKSCSNPYLSFLMMFS